MSWSSSPRRSSHVQSLRASSLRSSTASISSRGPSPLPGSPCAANGKQGDNIQVCVRVRPVLPSEEYMGTQTIISVEGNSCVLVDPTAFGAAAAVARDSGQTLDVNAWARHFTFDHCFWSANIEDPHYSGQHEVYEFIGARALEQAWQGYNCTILAYGQTGSGKSYSMMGLEPVHRGQADAADDEDGLIPRICESLFADIAEATRRDGGDDAELSFGVEVSYLEIYNEQVRDLFGPQAAPGRTSLTLRVREDPAYGAYVEGLAVVSVTSYDEIARLIAFGAQARTVATTNANAYSSRSHAIFTVTFRQQRGGGAAGGPVHEKVSRLNLVDLAGSERVGNTGAAGLRLREAGSINRSLAALSDVIKALSEAQRKGGSAAQSPLTPSAGVGAAAASAAFVPYRNSALTRLLRESLGGNARTVVLACVSPAAAHFEETLSTLKYAERAKAVRTHARVNEQARVGSDDPMMQQLMAEVEHLRRKLAEVREGPAARGADWGLSGGSGGGGGGGGSSGRSVVYVLDPSMEEELQRLQTLVQEKEARIQQLLQCSVAAALPQALRTTVAAVVHDAAAARSAEEAAARAAAAPQRSAAAADDDASDGFGGYGADAALPRLVNLNQDPLFSECLVYALAEGAAVVGSAQDADIQLCADDVLPRHALVTHAPGGLVTLMPLDGAAVYVNGTLMSRGAAAPAAAAAAPPPHDDKADPQQQQQWRRRPVLLTHHARVFFGRHHVLRFEHARWRSGGGGGGAVVDWEFAHNELLRKNPELAPQGGGAAVQQLREQVEQLQLERDEVVARLRRSQEGEQGRFGHDRYAASGAPGLLPHSLNATREPPPPPPPPQQQQQQLQQHFNSDEAGLSTAEPHAASAADGSDEARGQGAGGVWTQCQESDPPPPPRCAHCSPAANAAASRRSAAAADRHACAAAAAPAVAAAATSNVSASTAALVAQRNAIRAQSAVALARTAAAAPPRPAAAADAHMQLRQSAPPTYERGGWPPPPPLPPPAASARSLDGTRQQQRHWPAEAERCQSSESPRHAPPRTPPQPSHGNSANGGADYIGSVMPPPPTAADRLTPGPANSQHSPGPYSPSSTTVPDAAFVLPPPPPPQWYAAARNAPGSPQPEQRTFGAVAGGNGDRGALPLLAHSLDWGGGGRAGGTAVGVGRDMRADAVRLRLEAAQRALLNSASAAAAASSGNAAHVDGALSYAPPMRSWGS